MGQTKHQAHNTTNKMWTIKRVQKGGKIDHKYKLKIHMKSIFGRVERDEYRRPETYAVREQFSLFLICWVEREKILFLFFESGFDDAMNMENENIQNSHHKVS